jgi:hypothetical protein
MKMRPEELPDDDHELVIERVCAVDVAKAAGKVCVRLPGKTGRRFGRVWDVPARTGAITELGEQLVELRVERVTVESTACEAGGGHETGPQPAEIDAAFPRERSAECAAGHVAQRWPQDGRGRRHGRAREVGKGRDGRLAAVRQRRVVDPTGQAGVHSEGQRKTRGLGIPVIADQALQARTVNALEPKWEARLESRSYGFRPGRSC